MVGLDYYPQLAQDWARAQEVAAEEYPWTSSRIHTSMKKSQLKSKLWIAEEFKWDINKAIVIGGWYCHYLSTVLIDKLGAEYVVNYEIDPDAVSLSRHFNRRYVSLDMFKSKDRDVFLRGIANSDKESDVIVNTSCEHMFPMKKIVEKNRGKLFVLQSSDNKEYKDHINPVDSPEQLAEQAGIQEVLYSGVLDLTTQNRFMVIGR